MRFRFPIALALGAFLVASCQDAPVEPNAEPGLSAPEFAAGGPHNRFRFTDEFDNYVQCGPEPFELAHFTVTGMCQWSEHEDGAGGYHSQGNCVAHGTGIGEFGSEWIYHQSWPTAVYFPPGSVRVYNDVLVSLWVGKAQAPSWNDWITYKYTMNANGEVTVERESHRTVCE